MGETITAENVIHSRAYRLIQPYQLQEVQIERKMSKGEVTVQPILGSICHADIRYFTGNRRPEALAEKLPMTLIHEGIGVIVESAAEEYRVGQLVAIVPNIPGYTITKKTERDQLLASAPKIEDNYSLNGRFLGSGTDGIAQSKIVMPAYCVVPIPEDVPNEIAVLAELSTISHQAIRHVKSLLQTAKVAIFGDGPVGYLTGALIHHYYKVDADRLKVYGVIPEKLAQFDFATCSLISESDFTGKDAKTVDIAIECAGGKFSSDAINQAIDVLKPGGQLILLGVTEELVPINTRDILEKGITVFGSSRSSFHDFHAVIQAMRDIGYQKSLRKLIPDQFNPIHSIDDFANAMKTSEQPHWQKVILDFHWEHG